MVKLTPPNVKSDEVVKLNPSPLPSKATAPSVLGTNATLEL